MAAVAIGLVAAPPAQASCSGLLRLHCQQPPSSNQSSSTQTPPPATKGSRQTYGFNDNGLFNGQIPRQVFLNKLQSTGATYLRSPINWQFYEPQYKRYDNNSWGQFDRNYQDLLARGVHQVITLIGTPYWALTPSGRGAVSPGGQFRCDGSSATCVAPPDINLALVRSEWQAFVRKVVARYPKAAAIEVWNEPNIQYYWLQHQDPVLYAHLLAATAQAVHQVAPSMPVLTGSTAGYVGASNSKNTSADVFLRDIYKTAGAGAFNAIGWHFYPCKNGQTVAFQGNYTLNALRKVRDSFGDTRKSMWLTEVGASSSGSSCGGGRYGTKGQEDVLAAALDWARGEQSRYGDVPVVIVHELMNASSRKSMYMQNKDAESEYGLVAYHYDAASKKSTFQDKPAFSPVRCRMTGGC